MAEWLTKQPKAAKNSEAAGEAGPEGVRDEVPNIRASLHGPKGH
ncbi:hypothetical protein JV46_28770 [Solemya velum gill symbiont]|uniref:Uncharacterized protein n=1 Tax=Solemya velum gill symbiont TaxID=2340 RepID=A0A0B0H2R2_SOVGS|nr:hypothetical protein JV46_28770 [Solemya velum gill symbiont]